ncbi:PREDICTED: venom carboxylesterase-6-like [Nicrophorus vespilloides]|uniref:Venom carboxylesterase-6-like n=1 Tax=Nicrophorus vespilloides TaxID=110193 RepID=A0ABM1MCK3_NICVS|nr:PREDICTED: venom carboxylesterase-6-like [Nicrophorus vespilloides]
MILLYVVLSIFVVIHGENSPIVQTGHGPVIGLSETSRSGKNFYSFRKIPYAKPPLGNLRFKVHINKVQQFFRVPRSFYSTVDDATPGNYGYKDMVLALKWVQENINNFGGNKHKVTIFGQSIGGIAVHYMILSPAGKNLFHWVISQSGTALNIWGYPKASFHPTSTFSKLHNVIFFLNFKIFSNEPSTIFSTVNEAKNPLNSELFLTKGPMKILQSGHFNQVPWITGITSDDGIIKASPLVRLSNTLKQLNANFDKLGPQLLFLPLSRIKCNLYGMI